MRHLHHIIPKHMGGSDEPDNLIELSIEAHAEAHKKLWEEHGNWEDKIAWKALSGQITMSEASKEAKAIGQKLGGQIQGAKSVENGHLQRICTDEVRRLGAKARYEKHGHIHSNMSEEAKKRYQEGHSKGGKIGGVISTSVRWICHECGKFTNTKGISYHKRNTNHVLMERV